MPLATPMSEQYGCFFAITWTNRLILSSFNTCPGALSPTVAGWRQFPPRAMCPGVPRLFLDGSALQGTNASGSRENQARNFRYCQN